MAESIFNTTSHQSLISRIDKLSAESTAKWGKMNVAQMLAHTRLLVELALGTLHLKRSLLGRLFGRFAIKRIVADDRPLKTNIPTDPRFLFANPQEFAKEKAMILNRLHELHTGGPNSLAGEHAFFGKLSTEQWDILLQKHFDHHLRQFGV